MEYRQLGNSDLKVSVVSFGAWAAGGWMWGGPDDAKSVQALKKALDHGINCIDTAPSYGLGHSEVLVGRAIKGKRDQVIIATKCGFRWDEEKAEGWESRLPSHEAVGFHNCLKKESIIEELENSLKRLQTDYIDLYQCHAPDPDTPIEETMETLLQLQKEGKIRYFGVSNFSADQMREALKYASFVSSQNMYNIIIRDFENEELPVCRDNHIGVLTYTPLLLGLLTGQVSTDREFPDGDLRKDHHLFRREFRVAVLEMLSKFRPLKEKYEANNAQLSINWLLCQPGVSTVISGIRNTRQLESNVRAGTFQLEPEEVEFMKQKADELIKKLM